MWFSLRTAEVISNSEVHLVTLSSNGQGAHHLSANDNAYYLGINSDNNIQALPYSENINVNSLQLAIAMCIYVALSSWLCQIVNIDTVTYVQCECLLY